MIPRFLRSQFVRRAIVCALLLLSNAVLAFAQPQITHITAVDVIFSTIGSGQPDVGQGGWAQMWGEGLTDGAGNATIFVNGVMTLSEVLSSSRVFFRIPPETALGPAQFVVTVGGQSDTFSFPVSAFAPAGLTGSSGGGGYHADQTLVTESNPLRPGETFIAVGLTGLGLAQPPQLMMMAGGQQIPIVSLNDNVAFQDEVPALPGLYILQGAVPELAPGCYPVTLTIGGASWTSTHADDLVPVGTAGGSEAVSCSSQPSGPLFTSDSLLGAAAFGQAASGGLGSLFVGISDFIGDAQANAATIPLSTQMAMTTIEFTPGATSALTKDQGAGVLAPLVFVSGPANQVNLQIPWEVPPGTASVVVTAGGVASDPVDIEIAEFAPGIFSFDFGRGRAVAFFNDGAIVQPVGTLGLTSRPAVIGEGFSVLATGLGPTSPATVTGDNSSVGGTFVPRDTVAAPTVTIGGVAAQVFGSILSPEFVGVYQVVVIPQEGTPMGDAVPIVIDIGDALSRDDVTVAIGPAP